MLPRRFATFAARAAVVASCFTTRIAPAQGVAERCADRLVATSIPARPVPGTLFTLRVHTTGGDDTLRGNIAGEPLHLTSDSAGGWRALAAVPIDSKATLGIVLACAATPGDSVIRQLELANATYTLERLRVAPQFSEPPDSALAARQRLEAQRAAEVSRGAHITPRLWSDPFVAPRASRMTSTFGRGREFNGTVTSRHMGTDFAGAVGAPVRASNRGVVRLVDRFFLGGNVVYIDHGEGIVTAYLHLSQHRVAMGDTVQRGQVIGEVGATGRVTGPHLHWIARYGGISVDPLSLIRVTSAPPHPGAPKTSATKRKPGL